ncbi:MAG: hypothetical protein IIX96_01255 [Clostridia bacterium]|nr:hypothetical protein [Clostridia bacterium]
MAINDKKGKPLTAMTLSQREAMIVSVETERLGVIEKIEETMREYAKESRKSSLGKRRARVGKALNDFKK